jgi:rare lipoprotein A
LNRFLKKAVLVVALMLPVNAYAMSDDQSYVNIFGSEQASYSHRSKSAPVVKVQHAVFETNHSAPMRLSGAAFHTRASWYGGGEKLAKHTASGEVFRAGGLTAAHRTLPLGTRLAVTMNGRTVVVRVNDRGPAKWTGRSLDLSRGAAVALGMIRSGTGNVSYVVASR